MKKRGFTLIELLAVIVVLAIIALIATPIVMNVIKNASAGAAERSADNYLKAVEMLIATEKLDGTPLVDGEYTIGTDGEITLGENTYEVEVSGTKPTGGIIVIKDGQVVKNSSAVNYKDYTVKFEDGVAKAEESGKVMTLSDCDFLEEDTHNEGRNPNTVGAKYTCNFGDRDRNFYILETSSQKTSNSALKENEVTLILEGNYDMETLKWCASGKDNSCAADNLEAKLDDIVENTWTKLNRSQIGIPSASQIVVADGKVDDAYLTDTRLTNEWLYSYPEYVEWSEEENPPYGYWTSTPFYEISNLAFTVYCYGDVEYDKVNIGNDIGVRPVITLSI